MKRVMWFRRDLRLQDNKALAHALQNSAADELILLFQMNPQQFIRRGARSLRSPAGDPPDDDYAPARSVATG